MPGSCLNFDIYSTPEIPETQCPSSHPRVDAPVTAVKLYLLLWFTE